MVEKKGNELVSVRQAAQECGRNTETVRRWIWSGKLPAEKLGNQLFIKREDFVNYCRETSVAYDAKPRPARETSVAYARPRPAQEAPAAYDARPRPDAASLKGTAKEKFGADSMETTGRRWHETTDIAQEREMKLAFLKKATDIRNRIRARTGESFEIETMIRELRDKREDELE